MHTVLLIEDNAGDARLIREMIAEVPGAPFEIECAERLAQGLERLSAGGIGLVLLDLSLPDSMGLETFAQVFGVAAGGDRSGGVEQDRAPAAAVLAGEDGPDCGRVVGG